MAHLPYDSQKCAIWQSSVNGGSYSYGPVELPTPGIQDIEWVELYDKFQLLVPSEHHVDWFYFLMPPPRVTHEWVKAN